MRAQLCCGMGWLAIAGLVAGCGLVLDSENTAKTTGGGLDAGGKVVADGLGDGLGAASDVAADTVGAGSDAPGDTGGADTAAGDGAGLADGSEVSVDAGDVSDAVADAALDAAAEILADVGAQDAVVDVLADVAADVAPELPKPNGAPSAPTVVQLTPPAGAPCTAYVCSASGAVDPDGDPVTYTWRWTVDGATAGGTTANATGLVLVPGSKLRCHARANDGKGAPSAEVASNEVVVAMAESFPLSGSEPTHDGNVAWNIEGPPAGAKKQGHALPASLPCVAGFPAYYFAGSRDAVAVDAQAKGFAHLVGVPVGFPAFAKALTTHGFTPDQIEIRYGPQSLGADQQGVDWVVQGTTETRWYQGGTLQLRLDGKPLVGGAMPKSKLTIEYKDTCNTTDDVMSGETEYGQPVDETGAGASAAHKAVAAAFLQDVGKAGIRLTFTAQQPAIKKSFTVDGLLGGFFDVPTGKLERGPCAP